MGTSDWALWVGIATGVITILAAIAGGTRYITQVQFKLREEQLNGELKRLQEQAALREEKLKSDIKQTQERFAELDENHKEHYRELEDKYQELRQIIASMRSIGSAALIKKTSIDNELAEAMQAIQASASSILVPGPSSSASNFVFLSLHGPATSNLRRSRVPINKGIAGYVFREGKPYITSNAQRDSRFFDRVDKLSKYQTLNIICVPLVSRGRVVGVAQFLNKAGNAAFDEGDLRAAERYATSLAPQVADFVSNAENFELLGMTPERDKKTATVMFCDLTGSSLLMDAIDTYTAIDLINVYLEKLCDVAIGYGATVDKYLGDGVMLRFNVPRPVTDATFKAVQAAMEMQKEFEKLKEGWIDYEFPVKGIYNRIGIASGPVYDVVMGHPQYQHITLMGDPVHLASNLCEAADRSKNIVVIDELTYQALTGRIEVRDVSQEMLRKMKSLSSNAYELIHLTRNPHLVSVP